ncbi:YfjI family protein [Gramella jeungdoensis]|uniref:YfjI family protein n=1 Tax=Gramella jeungdoensis TaxID=708091 RepID=A0ABT0Z1V4_9FLAO|nr:DUF3987 domain-containing protein [Gramella jeungdoensis]MCM8569689.1 YfjI family protein [Gramella jeungdoensis]
MNNTEFDNEIYENLPPLLKGLTGEFKGREKDIVLLSSLGVLSSCLPNVFGEYDGKPVSANLYVMIIAPPASGKGVMNYAKLLIEPIHKRIIENSLSNLEDCQSANKGKKEKEPCPPIVTKVIPGNISAAEIYSIIKNAHYGGLIIESEADTLSAMLNQDWGNFSDVLRKAFHHESISISRKVEKLFMEIREPKLSLVLSGTPDQLMPLIKSKDNGLFSRIVFYFFEEISDWRDVFQNVGFKKQILFEKASMHVYNMYDALVTRENEKIQFALTEDQMCRFNTEMNTIFEIVKNNYSASFTSNVKRHGLVLFRLCMILTLVRADKEELKLAESITCNDEDFDSALFLVKQLLYHANTVLQNINSDGLSEIDNRLLSSLSQTFTRKQALESAKKLTISERSLDEKLVKWRKEKLIIKVSHGKYKLAY